MVSSACQGSLVLDELVGVVVNVCACESHRRVDVGLKEAANTKYQGPEVSKYSPSILRQTAHWLDVGLGWLTGSVAKVNCCWYRLSRNYEEWFTSS